MESIKMLRHVFSFVSQKQDFPNMNFIQITGLLSLRFFSCNRISKGFCLVIVVFQFLIAVT